MSNFANPQEDSYVLRLILASGTAALPSVVFANDLTKGLSWTTNGLVLSGLATPVNPGDAASKAYVDSGTGGDINQLTGDVTAGPGGGSQVATVAFVDGSSAANVHLAELAANAATNVNTVSTIVKRDSSGNFSAGTITASLTGTASGNLTSATGVTDIHADSSSALHGAIQFISGTNVTLSQVGQAITINAASGTSFPLLAPDGTDGAPTYAFAADPTTGLFNDHTNGGLVVGSGSHQFVLPTNLQLTLGPADDSVGVYIFYDGTNLQVSAQSATEAVIFNTASVVIPNLVSLQFGATNQSDGVQLFYSTGNNALHLAANADATINLEAVTKIVPGATAAATFDEDVTAGNTRMLLWDVDKNALSRITVGAADSGGTGFKVLRVPN